MEALNSFKKGFQEHIWNNEQVIQLRQKFAELDAETQSYVLIGSFGAFLALLFGSLLFLFFSNLSLKADSADFDENIQFLSSSAEKIEDYRVKIREQSSDQVFRDLDRTATLKDFTDKVLQKSFLAKESYEILNDKQSTAAGMITSTVDVKLNKISLRQLVRALFFLEESHSGINVEKFSLDEKNDTAGYLWASLTLKRVSEQPKKGTH